MAKITNAGMALLAQLQSQGSTLNIDKFIYANIPGLDPAVDPDPDSGKPDVAYIVHESAVTKVGYVDEQTVIYTNRLATDVGDFSFNWIGLWCSEHNTLIALTYVDLQYKRQSSAGIMGNTLSKVFGIQYTDIQSLANITIAADESQLTVDILQGVVDTNISEAMNTHEADPDPHPGYLKSISGKTIVSYGVVSAAGAKLSGSDNWTVARNSTGCYQLNITDTGDYIVLLGQAENSGADAIQARHNQTTGIFNNNTASNIVSDKQQDGGGVMDGSWIFYAIKL